MPQPRNPGTDAVEETPLLKLPVMIASLQMACFVKLTVID